MLPLEEQFHCLACSPSAPYFPTFPLLCSHFHSNHGIPSLMNCPATNAVLLPSSLASHTCLLCREGGMCLGLQEVQEHLGSKHGRFFRERWREYSTLQCRVCGEKISWEEDVENHIAREHNRENFAKENLQEKKARISNNDLESDTGVLKPVNVRSSSTMVIDISEEEPHEEMVTVRVKKISRTPPSLLQEAISAKPEIRAKKQFVDLVLESEECLGGVSLYLSSAEVVTLIKTDGKGIRHISKRTETKIFAHGFKSDHTRKVNIIGSEEAVKSAVEKIRNKFSKRIATTITASEARVMCVDGCQSLMNVEKKTGATISVEKKSVGGEDKQMVISGSEEAVTRAKAVVMDLSRIILTNDEVNKLFSNKSFALMEICRKSKASIVVEDRRMASVFGLKEAKEKAILMIRNL